MEFRWNDWNLKHATKHGVRPEEAEYVVRTARRPYPERALDGRWLASGQAPGGRYLQVVFLMDEDGTLFIIHARPLTEMEQRRYRRRIQR